MADVPASKATQTTNGTASAAADSAPAATTTMTNAPAKNNPSSMLPYMHLLEALKTTKRTGWINESIPLPGKLIFLLSPGINAIDRSTPPVGAIYRCRRHEADVIS